MLIEMTRRNGARRGKPDARPCEAGMFPALRDVVARYPWFTAAQVAEFMGVPGRADYVGKNLGKLARLGELKHTVELRPRYALRSEASRPPRPVALVQASPARREGVSA